MGYELSLMLRDLDVFCSPFAFWLPPCSYQWTFPPIIFSCHYQLFFSKFFVTWWLFVRTYFFFFLEYWLYARCESLRLNLKSDFLNVILSLHLFILISNASLKVSWGRIYTCFKFINSYLFLSCLQILFILMVYTHWYSVFWVHLLPMPMKPCHYYIPLHLRNFRRILFLKFPHYPHTSVIIWGLRFHCMGCKLPLQLQHQVCYLDSVCMLFCDLCFAWCPLGWSYPASLANTPRTSSTEVRAFSQSWSEPQMFEDAGKPNKRFFLDPISGIAAPLIFLACMYRSGNYQLKSPTFSNFISHLSSWISTPVCPAWYNFEFVPCEISDISDDVFHWWFRISIDCILFIVSQFCRSSLPFLFKMPFCFFFNAFTVSDHAPYDWAGNPDDRKGLPLLMSLSACHTENH